jgi:hypothetical protein
LGVGHFKDKQFSVKVGTMAYSFNSRHGVTSRR